MAIKQLAISKPSTEKWSAEKRAEIIVHCIENKMAESLDIKANDSPDNIINLIANYIQFNLEIAEDKESSQWINDLLCIKNKAGE